MTEPIAKTIPLDSREEAVILLGPRDQFLRLVRDTLGVKLFSRGDTLSVEGTAEGIEQTERVFQQLRGILRKSGKLMRRMCARCSKSSAAATSAAAAPASR